MKGKEERNGAKGKWGKEGKGRKKGRAKGSKGGRKERRKEEKKYDGVKPISLPLQRIIKPW